MDLDYLSIAFTVWAAVVALVGGAIVYELSRLRVKMEELGDRMGALTIHFERRLTRVETTIGIADKDG